MIDKASSSPPSSSTITGGREIGREIHRLSNALKRHRELTHHDARSTETTTPMQGSVLCYLHAHEAEGVPVFQRDLEKHLNIRRSTATGILQLLERDGMILREPVPQDARLKRLVLTPKAEEQLACIRENILQLEAQMRSGLSEEEIDTLFLLLARIRQNLEAYDRDAASHP